MNRKILFTAAAFLLAFTACEDIIDVDLNSVEPRLVIDASIRMGAPAEVRITKTKDFSDNTAYTPISEAVVSISDDAGNTEVLPYDASGKFIATTIRGVERRTYQLTVTYEEVEYTATTYMPPRVEIDSLTQWKFPIHDYPFPQIHFKDPIGKENEYYRLIIGINDEYPRLREPLISTEFMDGSMVHLPVFVSYEDGRDEDAIKKGDKITVEMRCIDKGTYTFFYTRDNMENALANPTSNISGGALGYFGAYSYTSKEIVMEW
ncbi:DUF4249 domain-containing protein [Bacteroides sp. 224]|uniref:DUF4249 domain-containing protein n=1 Tax=Bacteroides sp. 224 TaxID=2302936 RepID=UPI001EF33A45|nr:DUF4249 domain-containing protein [Bacteroides sp. 224]